MAVATATATKVASTASSTATQTAATVAGPATQPVSKAVAVATATSTKVAGTASSTATKAAATVAGPATQPVANAVNSVRHAAAPATQPVARVGALAGATTQPATQAVAAAAKPIEETTRTAVSVVSKPVARAVARVPGQATDTAAPRSSARSKTAPRVRARARHLRSAVGGASRAHVRAARPVHTPVVRRIAGGRAAVITARSTRVAPIARSLRLQALSSATVEPAETTGALAPPRRLRVPPLVVADPASGNSESAALALATLIGAGGIALLRARHFAAAAGLQDAGTLTALGHSASTFWAGSCVSLSSSGSTMASAPLTASSRPGAIPPGSTLGGRAQYGVAGALSGVVDGVGGRVAPATSSVIRPGGSDSTALVTLLFAACAVAGAALGRIVPRPHGAQEADVG